MNTQDVRELLDELGIPQPDKIYRDKYKTGQRFKLIWQSWHADGSRIVPSHPRTFSVPVDLEEEWKPILQSYARDLQDALPEAVVNGYIGHGFMYGWNMIITIHDEGAKPTPVSLERAFRREFGYTQG